MLAIVTAALLLLAANLEAAVIKYNHESSDAHDSDGPYEHKRGFYYLDLHGKKINDVSSWAPSWSSFRDAHSAEPSYSHEPMKSKPAYKEHNAPQAATKDNGLHGTFMKRHTSPKTAQTTKPTTSTRHERAVRYVQSRPTYAQSYRLSRRKRSSGDGDETLMRLADALALVATSLLGQDDADRETRGPTEKSAQEQEEPEAMVEDDPEDNSEDDEEVESDEEIDSDEARQLRLDLDTDDGEEDSDDDEVDPKNDEVYPDEDPDEVDPKEDEEVHGEDDEADTKDEEVDHDEDEEVDHEDDEVDSKDEDEEDDDEVDTKDDDEEDTEDPEEDAKKPKKKSRRSKKMSKKQKKSKKSKKKSRKSKKSKKLNEEPEDSDMDNMDSDMDYYGYDGYPDYRPRTSRQSYKQSLKHQRRYKRSAGLTRSQDMDYYGYDGYPDLSRKYRQPRKSRPSYMPFLEHHPRYRRSAGLTRSQVKKYRMSREAWFRRMQSAAGQKRKRTNKHMKGNKYH